MSPFIHRVAIENAARAEGLVAGFAPVDADLKKEYFDRWIAEGQHAGMRWMDNARRKDPQATLPECETIIVFGLNYYQPQPETTPTPYPLPVGGEDVSGLRPHNPLLSHEKIHNTSFVPHIKVHNERSGKIATYALGADYHDWLLEKLKRICTLMEGWGSNQKAYVDTGPIMEKRFAAATVLGWQGKNTLLISSEYGPWLFLGVILTTLRLPTDKPSANRCGSCVRCMKACPTGAITAPYQLDARRCVAYWTIEHKGEIPEELHGAIGDRLFGCDDCLTACPWNKFAKTSSEIRVQAHDYPGVDKIMEMDEAAFERTFAGTPIHRLGLERLKRNARIVMKNGIGANMSAKHNTY
jgi:epoxyqueuosine reductase